MVAALYFVNIIISYYRFVNTKFEYFRKISPDSPKTIRGSRRVTPAKTTRAPGAEDHSLIRSLTLTAPVTGPTLYMETTARSPFS